MQMLKIFVYMKVWFASCFNITWWQNVSHYLFLDRQWIGQFDVPRPLWGRSFNQTGIFGHTVEDGFFVSNEGGRRIELLHQSKVQNHYPKQRRQTAQHLKIYQYFFEPTRERIIIAEEQACPNLPHSALTGVRVWSRIMVMKELLHCKNESATVLKAQNNQDDKSPCGQNMQNKLAIKLQITEEM